VVGCTKCMRTSGDKKKVLFVFVIPAVLWMKRKSYQRSNEMNGLHTLAEKNWTPSRHSHICAKQFINGVIVLHVKPQLAIYGKGMYSVCDCPGLAIGTVQYHGASMVLSTLDYFAFTT